MFARLIGFGILANTADLKTATQTCTLTYHKDLDKYASWLALISQPHQDK